MRFSRMPMTLSTVALLACASGVGGCSDSKEIWAASYDQSCVTAGDCVAVIEGECNACGHPCALGVIRASAGASYKNAYADLSCKADDKNECARCPYSDDSGLFVPKDFLQYQPVACEAGKCVVRYCTENEVRATTCLECSPADECLRSEERCLTKCTADEQCTSPQICQKDAGYCAFFCI